MSYAGNSLTGPDPLLQLAETRVQPTARGTTPISPVVHTGVKKAYICSLPNASMHRPDGTRIGFRFGFMETDLKATQDYLDNEIIGGHEFLRYATPEEIETAHMRLDPMGTMKDKIKSEMEQELRAELEAKIRAEMGLANVEQVSMIDVTQPNLDAAKLSGSDALSSLKARMGGTTQVTGATLLPVSGRLGGIVGSDKLAGNAAGSASGASE